MNPAKPISNGDGSMSSWMKLASTLGVGTAFGAAMCAMMYFGFIEPANTRQDQSESRQEKLIDSVVKTNTALTEANQQNALTLQQMQENMSASADQLFATVKTNGEAIRSNAKLNEKQIELLDGVTTTHKLQCEQLTKVTSLMESAAELMKPVHAMRQQALDKQDTTNAKLDQLITEMKK